MKKNKKKKNNKKRENETNGIKGKFNQNIKGHEKRIFFSMQTKVFLIFSFKF